MRATPKMPRIRERLPYPRVRESNTGHKSTKGVNGRNSDNTLIQKYLHWEPSTPLRVGLEHTYKWIYDQYLARERGDAGVVRESAAFSG